MEILVHFFGLTAVICQIFRTSGRQNDIRTKSLGTGVRTVYLDHL
jgi:hypothetical protein